MQKKKSDEILSYMIDLLTEYLTELSDVRDVPAAQFTYGEKTAYTECLEILAEWEDAERYGLNFNVEDRFPLL